MERPDGTYNLSGTAGPRDSGTAGLQRLTAMWRQDDGNELESLAAKIKDYLDILRSRARVMEIIPSDPN